MTEELLDQLTSDVVKQMREDINSGDTTAIFDLLYQCPIDLLIEYLPEVKHKKYE
jgi:hypothetical protein